MLKERQRRLLMAAAFMGSAILVFNKPVKAQSDCNCSDSGNPNSYCPSGSCASTCTTYNGQTSCTDTCWNCSS
jgi:hypothetical protein